MTSMAYAGGAVKTIKAVINVFSVSLDGSKLGDNNIFYNGSVYIPVSMVSKLFNTKPEVDIKKSTVSIKSNVEVLNNYKNQVTELQNQINNANTENEQLKSQASELNDLKAQNEKINAQLSELSNIKAENDQLKAKYEDYDKIKAENSQLNTKYGDYDNIKAENNQLKTKYADYDSIKAENEGLKAKLAERDAATSLPASLTIDNVSVKVTKITQDSDSLKIYVTYINNSDQAIDATDSMAKVTANRVQYSYDFNFDFDKYSANFGKDKVVDKVAPNTSEDSVIFMKPIPNIDRANLELSANSNYYDFTNLKVEVQP